MYLTRILLSIVFVLFASTALAAKPDKTLVCHVGNELSSMGETYMENPDCTIPGDWVGEAEDYICPDAGKIDLILVSTNAKHIGNEAHSFGDDSDYAPLLADVGDDPADFEDNTEPPDGIDDGCETEELLACPCWNTFSEPELVAAMNAENTWFIDCVLDPTYVESYAVYVITGSPTDDLKLVSSTGVPSYCFSDVGGISVAVGGLSEPDAQACRAEAITVQSQITWCSPD
jgi:hypothetical protein